MWLINTRTLKLEHAIDPEESNMKYAILSHTWEREEVTFQQFQNLRQARKMAGFAKIKNTCRLAKSQGLNYVWVDTCCIDKSSSAELSEAINSMFNYYQLAHTCYVYLSDMPDLGAEDLRLLEESGLPKEEIRASQAFQVFCKCRWFTRGWTLQELIAPSDVQFHNATWKFVGAKRNMPGILSLITGIESEILMDNAEITSFPACTRMSWAAKRETTRVEDIAYCLLGLFDINLPLIYGEGYKAFQRLQEEIVRTSGDVTILAWSSRNPTPGKYLPTPYKDPKTPPKFRGPFAWSPSEFAGSLGQTRRDPFRVMSIGVHLVNGSVEISTTGNLPLRKADGIGSFDLVIPGSGDSKGHRILLTPLGYAIMGCNEPTGSWTYGSGKHTSTIRLINSRVAMRINRSNPRFARYLFRFDTCTLNVNSAHPETILAWPARYFDNRSCGFIFAWPEVYPTQRVHILGLVACSISIKVVTHVYSGIYNLDLCFCVGAYARDAEKKAFEPWCLSFCNQSTDRRSRNIYQHLRDEMKHKDIATVDLDLNWGYTNITTFDQDLSWDQIDMTDHRDQIDKTDDYETNFRLQLAKLFSTNYRDSVSTNSLESLIASLQDKVHEVRSPDSDGMGPIVRYTTTFSTKSNTDNFDSIFKLRMNFNRIDTF